MGLKLKKNSSIKGNLCKGEQKKKKPMECHANTLKFRSELWFNTGQNKSYLVTCSDTWHYSNVP